MEDKVLLYDADGKKIGETFMRRARQLVKQQRAMWMDDRQRAVQFVADVDDWEMVDDKGEGPIPVFDDEAWMVDLAQKRIRQRRLYVVHSIIFGLGFMLLGLALALVIETSFGSDLTLVLVIALKSGWFFAFIGHTISFAVNYARVRRPIEKDERRARAVEKEVAEIKKRIGRE